MASGDLINYANYRAMRDDSAWTASNTWTDSTSFTVYISAPSFIVRARVSSVLFRSNWVKVTASYYNGSGWTTVFTDRQAYKSGAGSAEWKFYHNRAKEGTSAEDAHMHHLWKFVVNMRGKDGSAHGYFDLWCGGIEMMTESEWNSYVKGSGNNKIKWCKPGWSVLGGTYRSDAEFIAGERPSAHRGTPISVASGTYRYMCATDIS